MILIAVTTVCLFALFSNRDSGRSRGFFTVSGSVYEVDNSMSHFGPRVSSKNILTIGDDEEAPSEYLLGLPRDLATDKIGNIYVADVASMSIKMYDPAGSFVRHIGERGRGPGEFLDITTMLVSSNDEIIVADQHNIRFTRFSTDGSLRGTYALDTRVILWPRSIHEFTPHNYLMVYKLPEGGGRNRQLIHFVDDSFRISRPSIRPYDQVNDFDTRFTQLFAEVFPGNLSISQQKSLVYTPAIYSGKLYEYTRRDEHWVLTNTLKGHLHHHPSAITFDLGRYNDTESIIRIRHRGQQFQGVVNSYSIGLFHLKDGQLVHFSLQRLSDYSIVCVELFNKDNELVASSFLDKFLLPSTFARPPLTFVWKDDLDRFYMVDRRSFPVIRSIELTFEDVIPPPEN